MRLISLKKITDNMILAKNAYAREGNVLLAKGAPLKRSYAGRLLEWGVASVYIEDDRGELVEIDEDLYQKAEDDALRRVNEFLEDLNDEQLPESFRQAIIQISKQVLRDENIVGNLVEIEAFGEDLFKHCVTVSVLSMIIGMFAGYNTNQLLELATGSILLDLGKIAMSNRISDETELATPEEFAELQQHPVLGFNRLQKLKGNYQNSAQIILQHHEKYDGSGFPQGLKGDQIHEYARIATIADVYHSAGITKNDNQISGPQQIIERIISGSGVAFDPEFTRLFSQKVAPVIIRHKARANQSDADYRSSVAEKPKALPRHHLLAKLQKITGLTLGNRQKTVDHHDLGRDIKPVNRDHSVQDLRKTGINREDSLTGRRALAARQSATINELNRIRFEVTPERRSQTRTDALNIVSRSLAKISTKMISEKAVETIRATIDELLSDNDVINDLVTIQALNDNTFSHCVSVSLLSVMTGVSLGYNPEQLKELGTGAILVDLGKVELYKRYMVDSRSAGKLEYEVLMPEHTQLGFERLWELKRNTGVPYIALQHHEKYDGSGFPAGLRGRQINELARVVALADTYETLISEGINGQKLMPHEVIEYIRDFSGSHFDPDLSRVFLQNVTPFLIGSNVLLNNGEKAKVISINKDLLARPVVRVMADKDGNKLAKPVVKDLEKDLTLFIVSALKDDEF